jgi:hypothetical protein
LKTGLVKLVDSIFYHRNYRHNDFPSFQPIVQDQKIFQFGYGAFLFGK